MRPRFVAVNAICENEKSEDKEYKDGGEVVNACQCVSVSVCHCVCVCECECECVRQPSACYLRLMTLVSLYSWPWQHAYSLALPAAE